MGGPLQTDFYCGLHDNPDRFPMYAEVSRL